MNAIRLREPAGPSGLVFEQVDTPIPNAGEVLVRVHAAAITRDELDWPVDRLPAIPSYEFSGTVFGIGPDVDRISVGESVYALSPFNRNGAAVEYIVISKAFLAPKPASLDHIHAATIPLAGLTAWQGLFTHGKLAKGQRVLIHGASGGVGTFAVQLARNSGARVIGTVSTMNVEAAKKLGVNEVIDHVTTRFEDVVHDVDLVFDTVGGTLLERSSSVIRKGGRLVSVASEPSQVQAAARNITAIYFVVKPDGRGLKELTKLVEKHVLQPSIDKVYPLANAREAFERSLSPHTAGKIVLRVVDSEERGTST
jgi:NADPH:quinone reductase-like Zn-dependent oxidoreductase